MDMYEMVTNFINEYGYYDSNGWITLLLTDEIDKDLMNKAIVLYSKGDKEGCQKIVNKMFKNN